MDWTFYGREPELAEMKRIMSERTFYSYAVRGRRKVRKTEFIKEGFKRRGGRPPVTFNLPDAADATDADAVKNFNDALKGSGIVSRIC